MSLRRTPNPQRAYRADRAARRDADRSVRPASARAGDACAMPMSVDASRRASRHDVDSRVFEGRTTARRSCSCTATPTRTSSGTSSPNGSHPRFRCLAYDVRGAGASDATAPIERATASRELRADLASGHRRASPDRAGAPGRSRLGVDPGLGCRDPSRRRLGLRAPDRVAHDDQRAVPAPRRARFAAQPARGWRRRRRGRCVSCGTPGTCSPSTCRGCPSSCCAVSTGGCCDPRPQHGSTSPTRCPPTACTAWSSTGRTSSTASRSIVEPSTDLPVLLVVPTRDKYVSPAFTADLERFASDLTRVEIDAGHWVQRSHPDELADAIDQFVSAHRGCLSRTARHPAGRSFQCWRPRTAPARRAAPPLRLPLD